MRTRIIAKVSVVEAALRSDRCGSEQSTEARQSSQALTHGHTVRFTSADQLLAISAYSIAIPLALPSAPLCPPHFVIDDVR
jgi:hypothetical protein